MALGLLQGKTGRGSRGSARYQTVAGGHGGCSEVEKGSADPTPSTIKCHQASDAPTTTVAKQTSMR